MAIILNDNTSSSWIYDQVMENCIRQNNAIDIYEDYYGDLSVDRSSDPPAAKTINIFRYCLMF